MALVDVAGSETKYKEAHENKYAPKEKIGTPTLGRSPNYVTTVGLGGLKVITNGRISIDMEQGKPEFSEEELDSLRRGEEAMAEQQEMLAGKFKDAEELEKAYIELQKKLGSRDETEMKKRVREEEASEEVEVTPAQQLITRCIS